MLLHFVALNGTLDTLLDHCREKLMAERLTETFVKALKPPPRG